MVIQALSLWELSRSYEWDLDRFFKCVGTLTGEAHASDLPFGTKKYVRTKGAPNVYEDTFSSTVGAGRLTILNGEDNGQDRVTSAIVWLNGIEIFSPHDFKKSTYHLERKIDLLVDYPNTLKLELRSKPGSFIVVSLETALVSIVPHVVGMTYASAQTDIIAAGLQVGTITTANSDTVPADTVISQEPAAGVSVKQGTVVDMVVSLGPSGPPPVNGVLLDGPPDALALEVLQNVNLISGIPPSGRAIDASGSEVSLISLLVKLAPQATVDQVSALLTKFGARIIWMIEDVPYLLLHIPNPGSVSGLDALVGELEATSVFEQVLRSYFPENAVLPQNFDPATHNQFEVIDHLIGIHTPAAWNASNALQGKQVPTFLIADEFGDGAPQDSSFAIATNPGDYTAGLYVDGHGYHVLGIVASDFEGDFPTGLLPSLSAPLEVSAVDIAAGNSWGEIFGNLMTRLVALANTPGERVILNTSLQFSCGKISTVWQCAPPNAQLWAMTWLTMVRARNLEDRFLHVTAAGNIKVSGDDDARTA